MAVTHSSTVRTDISDFITAKLDVGGAGTCEFQSAGSTEVATLTFATTAFAAASGPSSTSNTITADSGANAGTITKAALKTNGGSTIIGCSVTSSGGGGDIELSSVVISAGQVVNLDGGLTYTAPA